MWKCSSTAMCSSTAIRESIREFIDRGVAFDAFHRQAQHLRDLLGEQLGHRFLYFRIRETGEKLVEVVAFPPFLREGIEKREAVRAHRTQAATQDTPVEIGDGDAAPSLAHQLPEVFEGLTRAQRRPARACFERVPEPLVAREIAGIADGAEAHRERRQSDGEAPQGQALEVQVARDVVRLPGIPEAGGHRGQEHEEIERPVASQLVEVEGPERLGIEAPAEALRALVDDERVVEHHRRVHHAAQRPLPAIDGLHHPLERGAIAHVGFVDLDLGPAGPQLLHLRLRIGSRRSAPPD